MPATSPVTTSVTTDADWFAAVYQQAAANPTQLPWDTGSPSMAMVNWLNAVAPSMVRCGARVCVIGCGLGDDARELMHRGYDVTAFDCCDKAVDRARVEDPEHASNYVQADLLEPPSRWRHRYDLVVEVNNLCWWSPKQRPAMMRAMSELLTMHGRLLVIGPACEFDAAGDGPPWPMTEMELLNATSEAGLVPDEGVSVFSDDDSPTQLLMRATFRRA